MTSLSPAHAWWTPAEIAAAGLPDLPATRQGVDALIERDGWRAQPGMAQRRSGKGGGWEYSWRLFPSRAQRKLLQAVARPEAAEKPTRDAQWAWFEGLPEAVKAKARQRLAILQAVEALEAAAGRHAAVVAVAAEQKKAGMTGGARTIWDWFAMVEGVQVADRLAYLAPRNRAAKARPRAKDCDPAFMDALKAGYLRLGEPCFTDSYRDAVRIARANGWETLPERTMRRRLDAEVSAPTQALMRKGNEALKRLFPPQKRDKSAMHALQAICGDFHKADVFVAWPGARGEPDTILRPQLCVFQDIYSGKVLSWRADVSANSSTVLLTAGDLIEDWGIPHEVLLDNGREFAAKAVTGGAPTRFRFKAKEDDIPGLFTSIGSKVHWATPYSGQSKTVERTFRDWAQRLWKDVRFQGAYTGHKPDAKPEDYGSRAIPLQLFLDVVAERIAEHNAMEGRQSEVAFGRSFDQVFAESYATAPITKATAEQRRFWMLGAEGLRADAKNGLISFMGNDYWEPWCFEIAGARVVVRFDPADLHAGVHVYSQDNAYLGHVACRSKVGFFSIEGAREQARARAHHRRMVQAEAAAHRRMTRAELGDHLTALAGPETVAPEAKVVRAVFGKPSAVPSEAPAGGAVIADLAARRGGAPEVAAPAADDTSPRALFRRALELERTVARGEVLTVDQARWLVGYQQHPDYAAERLLWDGDDAIFG
jgi:putative transposase